MKSGRRGKFINPFPDLSNHLYQKFIERFIEDIFRRRSLLEFSLSGASLVRRTIIT